MNDIINVTRSSLPDYEEFCREIADIWAVSYTHLTLPTR